MKRYYIGYSRPDIIYFILHRLLCIIDVEKSEKNSKFDLPLYLLHRLWATTDIVYLLLAHGENRVKLGLILHQSLQ